MTPVADNSLRKAAEFVRNLAPEAAEAMLGRLSADEADALRSAIAEVSDESRTEQDTNETAPVDASGAAASVSEDGAVELQLSAAPAEEPVVRLAKQPTPTVADLPLDGAAWLRSLRDADPQAIAAYLSREQPRAIAVVLGYLSPELGAGVLRSLPAEEQASVVAQLAEQGDTDPDSLRVIASGLSSWVEKQQEEQQRRTSRAATIRQLLAATPDADRRRILKMLSEAEPEIAATLADMAPAAETHSRPAPPVAPQPAPVQEAPRRPTIAFEDLSRVDGRALAEALGTLDARTALLALAGAPEAMVRKLVNGLPRQAGKELRSRIHRVGPTTIAEIDRAQNALTIAVEAVVVRRRAMRAPQRVEA